MGKFRSIALPSLLLLLAAAALPSRVAAQTHAQSPAYLDPAQPTPARVADLIHRLTLDEKVSQLQDNSLAIPRLQMPAYTWGNEGLHGDSFSGYATLFPQVIGMAATFDPALVHSMADVISTEARAKFNSIGPDHPRFFGISFWAPNINIFRDPRWGRGQETYGEDPFLTARMAVAYVTGLQGDDPRYLKALAGPKHFAVHSGPEADRHRFNSVVSPHDLNDTYLPAFHAALSEGHAGSVMCAYNEINGLPACANPWLLTTTIRDTWHWPGYVISDCGAIADISAGHHFAADDEHSSAAALKAGMDIACDWVPDGQRTEFSHLLEAVHDHLVTEAEIDTALARVLTMRFRLGMFDPPSMVPYSRITAAEIDTPAHAALALKAARESIVLLKNDHDTLPLHNPHSIAVVGPSADINQIVEGNYNAIPSAPVTPLIGLQKNFAGKATIHYAQGAPLAASFPVVIEYTTLHPSPNASAFGLTAEYFANPDLTGKPALTRIDRSINFDWDQASPVPGIPNEDYSVRWTGTFTPLAPGTYGLGAKARGCTKCSAREAFRLYLDDKLILQSDPPKGAATDNNFNASPAADANPKGVDATGPRRVVPITFTDTRPHTLRLEYTHHRVPTHHLIAGGIDLLWQAPDDALRAQAVAAAQESDVTVAFVGLSPELEGEELPIKLPGFLAGDRTSLNLPQSQEDLLAALAATGKPLVVVLMTGSAINSPTARAKASAILEAWYPGEAGGTAIAETLAGENNPAGRLPVTFYDNVAQLPAYGDYSMANRTYRYFRGQPIYGFGYGLSYTHFAYSDLKLSTPTLTPSTPITLTLTVKNLTPRAGDEVVELYLTPPQQPGAPLRRLIGFQRIHLAGNAEQSVPFTLDAATASSVMADGSGQLLPGTYTLFVGGAQPSEAASSVHAAFTVRP
jgi:beta-glucosidase